MPEILTESFCERCGTRYTFESASPKGARLKGLRVMSRGLRNFVMSDDSSIDEAMAAARNETDREVTSQQLDAFHKTFNFCMSCRQYTCGNCWNEVEGRCLSCAPHLGHDVLPAPFPNVDMSSPLGFGRSDAIVEDHNGHDRPDATAAEPMAWPTSDLMREEEQAAISFEDVVAEHEATEPEDVDPFARLTAWESASEPNAAPEPLSPVAAESEPVAEVSEPAPERGEPVVEWPEPEPVEPVEPVAAEHEDVVEPALVVAESPVPSQPMAAGAADEPADDLAAAAAAQTADLFRRFRHGHDIDDAIAAYERTQVAADALADAEPMDASEATAPGPEPTPVEAAAASEPAPVPTVEIPRPVPVEVIPPQPAVPAAPAPAPTYEPEPEPVAAVAPAPAEPTFAPDLDRAAAAALPEPEPAPEPAPEPIAAEVREDVVPQPTWQIVAPEAPVAPEPPAEPEWPAQPQWPARPEWPNQETGEGLAFLGRPAQPTGGIEALWAESAREVATVAPVSTPLGVAPAARPAGGVQPCVSCGLSLSANARFCRRCGTRQG